MRLKVTDSRRIDASSGLIYVRTPDYRTYRITLNVAPCGELHFSFRCPDPLAQRAGDAVVAELNRRTPFSVDDLVVAT